MRQRLVIYQLLLFCFLSKNLFAQPAAIRNNRDYYHWMFGVGWNFVDDDGYDFSNFFDVKNSWHSVAFPSRFTADKYFYNGWSFEGALAFNSYDETKLVNRTIHLYLTDEEFAKSLHTHTSLTISGSGL